VRFLTTRWERPETAIETERIIRLGAFIGVFAILAIMEVLAPRRKLTESKHRRWFANLTIVALNNTSMFNHSNIALPRSVDRVLRLLVVTPDMHRVHHSVIIRETNSNYGFSLPWWYRLFGTYKAQPAKGHTAMVIGLSQFRDPGKLSLPRLLLLPFMGDPGRVPINRH